MFRIGVILASFIGLSVSAWGQDYFYRLSASGLSGLSGMDGRSHIGKARDGFDGFNGQDGRDGDDGRHGEEGKPGRSGGSGGVVQLWLSTGSQPDHLRIKAEVLSPGHSSPEMFDEEVLIVPNGKILVYAVGGSGGVGGRGGDGQDGGDGGDGGDIRGFGHRSGNGGNGGQGGNAASGGPGGDGGSGGRVVVHLPAGQEDLASYLDIRIHGGLGGRSGMNGRAGRGGQGEGPVIPVTMIAAKENASAEDLAGVVVFRVAWPLAFHKMVPWGHPAMWSLSAFLPQPFP